MREDFLHFIWRYGLFDKKDLQTSKNQPIQILNSGTINSHAGPDFFDAKIELGDIIWVGNVEIHLLSSDWNKHNHQFDSSYDSVVLHVVWSHDTSIYNSFQEEIPTLELCCLVEIALLEKYKWLSQNLELLPCATYWKSLEKISIENWLERLAIERIEAKSSLILSLLKSPQKHTSQVFFEILAKNFGFHLNALPMEMIARSIPFTLIQKLRNTHFSVEALLFGQAGFLNQKFKDAYPLELQKEYEFLRIKHQLRPIDNSIWKFLRLRPSNFPTIRLAQFAASIRNIVDIINVLESDISIQEWKSFFVVEPHDYWLTHYRFNQNSKIRSKQMGTISLESILINAVVSFLVAYGHFKQDEKIVTSAINLLLAINPEDNVYTRSFKETNFIPSQALHTQGLRQLNEFYCKEKKCVNCNIGVKILLFKNKKKSISFIE